MADIAFAGMCGSLQSAPGVGQNLERKGSTAI